MNYIERSNQVLFECVNLINNIEELPTHAVDRLLQNYIPFGESENVKLLQTFKSHMNDNELKVADKTLTIVLDIDQAINQYTKTDNIENLKAIIREIDQFYKIG